ncbi:response regulator receiver domain-containing [Trichoderma cornu-damae]|uniref:Response regulator receiver domain-containing n=1 Tax=Trichoderma cornu-damae TaxID=654480 RepID=A0A9P8TT88_9HYPO|nr:response regulator receiver domain-containing [Trichoderma cornu-damae]
MAPEPLPVHPSSASAPPSAASVFAKSSCTAVDAPARPSAPPPQTSRDPNQAAASDKPARQSPPSTENSDDNNNRDKDTTARALRAEPLAAIASLDLVASPPPPPSSASPLIPAAPAIPARSAIDFEYSSATADPADLADFDASSMAETTRKVWVMRPKASPTMILINQNDLVDDVRDMILRKYANSLGKTFDSPDLTLRIYTRDGQHSRALGPEEPMGSTLDEYYPGGQTVKEALVIDIARNAATPRPSPRAPPHPSSSSVTYYAEDVRPSETGEGYFPPVPGNAASPRLAMQPNGSIPHSMTRLSSPRLPSSRPKKSKRGQQQQEYHHSPQHQVINASVPPISVLIVEDNPINLKLLEAFVKRLKVRWQTAMNGREAVKKWRGGGFHLVLMDIQLPVMNGLEATREIRRLERVNNIGVFSLVPGSIPETTPAEELTEQDRLDSLAQFKSPVIIPVNFVWLERKVMEWGSMQALIDFDGWRQWKDYSVKADETEAANKRAQQAYKKNKAKKNRTVMAAL